MTDVVAPYVWLAPESAAHTSLSPARASDAEHERVRAWAASRGASLSRPSPWLDAREGDAASVEAGVEAELVRARDALSALDVATVESALGRAEALLRAHPELPQAAWLRAEVERGWANRFARAEPRDDARAARAWKRAASLDGGRAPGVGDVIEGALGAPDLVLATLRFDETAGLEVRLDGRVVRAGAIKVAEGDHHALVRLRGRVVWADWVGIAKAAVVTLPSFLPPPCTEDDFARVRVTQRDRDAVLAMGVTCGRWFLVRDAAIAQCRRGTCGPFVPMAGPSRISPTPPASGRDGYAPTWLTWTALGVGAVLAGTALVYGSGAFDKPQRETRWVAGGLRTE